MNSNYGGRSEKELALWMLDRMRDSEEFLAVLHAARTAGRPDVLDTPDYVARHKRRLKKLYQSDDEEAVEVPASLATKIEALVKRDGLSSAEELLEKALAAYLERHPKGLEGLPAELTTFELARAEIEGRTAGAFSPGFTATLAAAARSELDRQATADKAREAARSERGS